METQAEEHKCPVEDCDSIITEDSDIQYSVVLNDYICYGCYESDTQYMGTFTRYREDGTDVVYVGDLVIFDQYGDDIPSWLDNLLEDVDYRKWTSTDGWRGHFEIPNLKGLKQIASGWSTGWADETVSRKLDFNQWLEEVHTGVIRYPFNLYVVIMPTSNIFSVGIDVYVDDNIAEEAIERIQEDVNLEKTLG